MIAAEELAYRLASLGVHGRVEVHGPQLVIVPVGSVPDVSDGALRAEIVGIARLGGFSHVSLELCDDDDDAAVRRDQPH